MNARLSSWQADPAATRRDLLPSDPSERHPVAHGAILLVIAVVTMCWPGFDMESASAHNWQDAASKPAVASFDVDARDLLDDPQREQPWLDTCASLRDVAPAGCGAASRTWPGN
jgi:hypothetical protein